MASEPFACQVAVIGAGPAGLATAAALTGLGIDALVFDSAATPGLSWRGHYVRLRLHTVRWLSGLPGLTIPRVFGPWVPAHDYASYLEQYASHHRLHLELDTRVLGIGRNGSGWEVRTNRGLWNADHVVVATGYNRLPRIPTWPGIDQFAGTFLHSSTYRTAEPFRDHHVLVVGVGNSGAEIASDLAVGGAASVTLSVRTGPNILPRSIFGMPTQILGVLFASMPAAVMDAAASMTRRLTLGDLSRFGLPKPRHGLFTRVRQDRVPPVLDVGLTKQLKAGRITVVPAVESLEQNAVRLVDGSRRSTDVIIAATGFTPGLESLLSTVVGLDEDGLPELTCSGKVVGAEGLYLCGYVIAAGGVLREIGIQAQRIAKAIAIARALKKL